MTPDERAARRRETFRRSQAKRRAALRDHLRVVGVLNPDQAEAFRHCQDEQLGPVDDFALRALLTGAKFVANSGRRRGRKIR